MASQPAWVRMIDKRPHNAAKSGILAIAILATRLCAFLGGCLIRRPLGSCSTPRARQDQSPGRPPRGGLGRRHSLPRPLPVMPQGRCPGRRAQEAVAAQRAYPHRDRRRSRVVSPPGRPPPRHALLVQPARRPALAVRRLPAVHPVRAARERRVAVHGSADGRDGSLLRHGNHMRHPSQPASRR